MRESALFLLSLLVVVSVGVAPAILVYYGFVCVRAHTRISSSSDDEMYERLKGVRWFHRGNTSDLFFDSL